VRLKERLRDTYTLARHCEQTKTLLSIRRRSLSLRLRAVGSAGVRGIPAEASPSVLTPGM